MNKLLVLAAFLGYALAGENDFWTEGAQTGKGWVWDKTIVANEWFTATTFSEMDFGFGTFYHGSYNPAGVTTIRGQQYGVHLYSYGRQSLSFEALKNYKYIVDVQVEPVYVAPYVQSILWTTPRPGDNNAFSMVLSGDRQISAFDYFVYNGENGKVFTQSLFDVITDGTSLLPDWSTSFGYNENEFYHDWEDTKFQGNLLNKILPSLYTDLSSNILGTKNYYTKQF